MNKDTHTTQFRFTDRRLPWLGLLTMVALLILAMIFWRERAWMLDISYQTFLMVVHKTVQVQVYRFGAATVQSLPLIGILLEAPLAWVSWLYSIAFNLLFLGFFLGATLGFKREEVGVAIALLYVAMTYDGFYWQTSELQQGLGFLLLCFAALLRFPVLQKWWHYALWGLALIALVFYHPLIFMPFYFFLIWHWWMPQAGIPRRSLALLGGGMFAVMLVKQIWFKNWYDSSKTDQVIANIRDFFPNYFSFPAYGEFFHNLLWYWWGYGVLLLLTLFWLAQTKRWWGIVLLLLASAGFLVLTAIGDPQTPFRFYAEVNYYPLLAFLLVPLLALLRTLPSQMAPPRMGSLATGFVAKTTLSRFAFWGLALLITSRLLLIIWNSQTYTARVDYIRSLTKEASATPTQRFLISPEQIDQATLQMDWGLPYETLLQSSVEGPRPLSLVRLDNPTQRASALEAADWYHTPWGSFPLEQVNDNPYWKLSNTAYREFER